MRGVTLSLGAVIAAVSLLPTPEARAACFPCDGFPRLAPPTSLIIAADGVIAFSFRGSEVSADTILPYFTVAVRDSQNQPISGALVLRDGFSAIYWRPSEPWIPGAEYIVTTGLDRQQWGTNNGLDCETREAREYPVIIDVAPLPPASAPPVVVTTQHRTEPRDDLESLVCCDGAYPAIETSPHGACPRPALDHHGICRSLADIGSLEVSYSIVTDDLPEAVASNLAVSLGGSPWLSVVLYEPTCLRLETLDLARDIVHVDERCLGDDLADVLGDLARDPADELTSACEAHPYVCEIEGSRWDPDRCLLWPELKAESGCSCDVAAAPGLTLLVLLAFRRRRRRSPARSAPHHRPRRQKMR